MKRIITGLCFCFLITTINAQTFDRWAQVVHWDGISHWSRYMITLPAYQGPNSLPVPRMSSGTADTNFYIGVTGQFHFSEGDKTQNAVLYLNYPLVKNKISFDASFVPYEHYKLDQHTIEKRHVFSQFYYDNSAVGEIHLNTNIQLLNKWRKYIQLALRVGYRFPCGSGFGAARNTDGPGYYFDLSIGKPFGQSPFKWINMFGFYAWQIESDKFNQDDAVLFGSGFEYNTKKWELQTCIATYLGYLGTDGDKPVVYRFNATRKWKHWGAILNFQQGLHDVFYSTVEGGVRYNF